MMTNVQLYLPIGLPILAVLTSLTVSLIQISQIKEDIHEIRREAREDRKEAREDRLQILGKIDLLTGKVYEMMGQK